MITAVFYKKSGNLTGFKVSGHAGYADAGSDIVCASVTSSVQLACNLLTEYFGIDAEVSAQDNTVALKVRETSDISQKIIKGLYDHLDLISQQFKKTINLKFSEV